MSSSNNGFILEVKGLDKRFGQVHAVKDLTFQIRKGEIFGFLGPNGAGKTTTMRMITCYMPPTSGSIRVDGLDPVEQSLAVRQKIGYLPENNPLYNEMTVREYLQFVGEIRGIKGSKLSSRIDDMYNVCGLNKMSGRQLGHLSKGYRQRVGLAQAMIHNPDLLILDEPMTGLDPNQIIEIRNLIKKMGHEKTVIYCSHILSEVSATCDHILIINEGQIAASGTPDELTQKSSSGTSYQVRLKGDRYEMETRLSEIAGVSSVKVQSVENEWVSLTLSTGSKDDIGESIFKSAVDNKWSLSELKAETVSLEEVFKQLTRG